MSNNTNVYSDGGFGWSSGYLPGSIIEKRIPTTQFADNAIIIEGGTNGSMKVDVPLIVIPVFANLSLAIVPGAMFEDSTVAGAILAPVIVPGAKSAADISKSLIITYPSL